MTNKPRDDQLNSEPPNPQISEGQLAVLAITNDTQLRLILENTAAKQEWKFLWSESWSQALAVVEHRKTGVVLLDENHLGTDWRDALQSLLQPTHRCCVVLIRSGRHDRFCEEFIQDGGFKTLCLPVVESELIEVVRSAWDFWTNCIKRAYRYS